MGEMTILASKGLGFALGYALGAGLLIIVFFSFVGQKFGEWYFKSKKGQINTIMKIFGWLNLVAWFFPFAGYFIGFASWEFFKDNQKKTFKVFSIIGIALSIINGIAGIILKNLGYIT